MSQTWKIHLPHSSLPLLFAVSFFFSSSLLRRKMVFKCILSTRFCLWLSLAMSCIPCILHSFSLKVSRMALGSPKRSQQHENKWTTTIHTSLSEDSSLISNSPKSYEHLGLGRECEIGGGSPIQLRYETYYMFKLRWCPRISSSQFYIEYMLLIYFS